MERRRPRRLMWRRPRRHLGGRSTASKWSKNQLERSKHQLQKLRPARWQQSAAPASWKGLPRRHSRTASYRERERSAGSHITYASSVLRL